MGEIIKLKSVEELMSERGFKFVKEEKDRKIFLGTTLNTKDIIVNVDIESYYFEIIYTNDWCIGLYSSGFIEDVYDERLFDKILRDILKVVEVIKENRWKIIF